LQGLDFKPSCLQSFNWFWHPTLVHVGSSLARARNAVAHLKYVADISLGSPGRY
jgi:hypothetical protein